MDSKRADRGILGEQTMMSGRFKEYTRLEESLKKMMTVQWAQAESRYNKLVTGADFSRQLFLKLLKYAQKEIFEKYFKSYYTHSIRTNLQSKKILGKK